MVIPVYALTPSQVGAWKERNPGASFWLECNRFDAEPGEVLLVPGEGCCVGQVLLGIGKEANPMCVGALSHALPAGDYALFPAQGIDSFDLELAHLSYILGSYDFDRYKTGGRKGSSQANLIGCENQELRDIAEAVFLVRDMVNTPANDMNPATLQEDVERVAGGFGAQTSAIVGDDLLEQNYPLIHAVGRASSCAPRLIELSWGKTEDPLVSLVGKGVCFDTGGLNLKTASGMSYMKKDMGGAACALALAFLIMKRNLPYRVKLYVPAVENGVSGPSYRPGDVVRSRSGLSVEIGNTDAEGRLVLADALTRASEDHPAYLIDLATLTGAARVALGPDLPAFFTNSETLAYSVQRSCARVMDNVWHMPLWEPYQTWLKSSVADCSNVAENSYAGCIVAALFLQKFVAHTLPWMHLDLYAWRSASVPWCPKGGEAYAVRGLYNYLKGVASGLTD